MDADTLHWMHEHRVSYATLGKACGLSARTVWRVVAGPFRGRDSTWRAIERGMRYLERCVLRTGEPVRETVTCNVCGRTWRVMNADVPPAVCRWCKSRHWDAPRKRAA